MSEWKEKRLEDLSQLIIDCPHSTPKWKNEGVIVLRNQNIRNGRLDLSTPSYTDEEGYKSRIKRAIPSSGDIVLTREAPMGEVCKVPENLKCCLGQRMVLIRTREQILNSDFLLYSFQAPSLRHQILWNEGTGTTVSNIRIPYIKDFLIKYPNIEEQKEIAKTLASLDQKITLLRQQNQTLEELAQTLFKRWFVEFEFPFDFAQGKPDENGRPYKSSGGKMVESELGEIPEGWRVGRFDEIIEFSNGYAFSSKELLDEPTPTSIDVFKMGHIMKGGGFNPTKSKSYIEKINCEGLEKYILKRGDLLMCMTDMKDNSSLLGHTALMPVDDKYIVNQRVGLIRSKNELEIHFPYLYILTNSRVFISDVRRRANSGVQVNLSTNGIKETETIIASKEVNQFFNAITSRLFEKVLTNQEEIQTLTQLRDTLLPKLMSGEVRIQN